MKKLILILLFIPLLFIPILTSAQCDPLDGCVNGSGIYTWDSGDKYQGEFKDGLFHGNGTFFYSNGNKYIGQWKNDKENGQGIFILESGDKYDGQFKDGLFHGTGNLIFNGGDIYEGEFQENQFSGYGTLIYSNGNQYEGQWKNNTFHGQGIFTYLEKDKYEGGFFEGVKSDQGTYTYANGSIESGEWRNDKIWDGIFTLNSNKEGEEGLEIKFIYEQGIIIDTLQNNKNYFNANDIIGEDFSDTIKLIDRKSKYDIVLTINNVPVKWRFDTGAEITSISIDQWEKIKSKINYKDLNIIQITTGVGGDSSGDLVKIKDEIAIGSYLVKNFIIKIANNKHSLLGIDFLQKFSNVKWNMNEGTLIIYK